MRKLLGPDIGVRKKFRAVFRRFGKKTNYHGYADTTVLLMNIKDAETDMVVADHVWFAFTKGFEKLRLKPGMTLEFDARIKPYRKGYVNRKYKIDQRKDDYKLSHPTQIVAVTGMGTPENRSA